MNHPVFPVLATPAEAVRLLDAPLEALLDSAAALRERHHGKRISLCAIINARSGDCVVLVPAFHREILFGRFLPLYNRVG